MKFLWCPVKTCAKLAEGFKWLSLSDPNPSKRFHRIGWIMLHPASETAADVPKDEDGDGEMKSPVSPVVPQSTAQKALDAINGKTVKDETRGDFVCHVGVHNPPLNPRKKALWDLFSAPERIARDLQLARRLIAKLDLEMGDADGCAKIDSKVEDLRQSGLLQPATLASGSSNKKKNGLDTEMDEGEAEEGEEMEAVDEDDEDDEDLLVKKKQIDLMVEYLRRVHNFCFYCVFESDSVHELVRKCPGGHLRRPRSGLSNQAKQVARASAMGDPFPTKKQEASEDGEETPVAEEKRPQKLSRGEQQLQRLLARIDRLPGKQQVAFVLRHEHDLSYEDIAVVLATSTAAVESLLYRARQSLRHSLHSSSGHA